jgi:hypothetical protein
VGTNTLRATFNTPGNITKYTTMWVVPGGITPAWQGRVLRASSDQAYKRPTFTELMAPWCARTGIPCRPHAHTHRHTNMHARRHAHAGGRSTAHTTGLCARGPTTRRS